MLHGYCIRRAGDAPPSANLSGVGAAPVELVEYGGLGVWLSTAAAGPTTIERLREHEIVVRSALRSATPLPLRYGSEFADPTDVERVVREQGEEFARKLKWLDDRVEVGLRFVMARPPESEGSRSGSERPGPPVAEAPGLAYLQARRAELERAAAERAELDQLLDEAEAHFADLGAPSARTLHGGPELACGLAHLLHRTQLRLFRDRATKLASERSDLRIAVTGPWAPYSFV